MDTRSSSSSRFRYSSAAPGTPSSASGPSMTSKLMSAIAQAFNPTLSWTAVVVTRASRGTANRLRSRPGRRSTLRPSTRAWVAVPALETKRLAP
jgi:hypothetical protein